MYKISQVQHLKPVARPLLVCVACVSWPKIIEVVQKPNSETQHLLCIHTHTCINTYAVGMYTLKIEGMVNMHVDVCMFVFTCVSVSRYGSSLVFRSYRG